LSSYGLPIFAKFYLSHPIAAIVKLDFAVAGFDGLAKRQASNPAVVVMRRLNTARRIFPPLASKVGVDDQILILFSIGQIFLPWCSFGAVAS